MEIVAPNEINTVEVIRNFNFNLKTACGICREEFDNKLRTPKVLVCGHSVCLECLKKLLESVEYYVVGDGTSYSNLLCPMCRTSMPVPNLKAAGFPNNFQLLEEIDSQDSRLMVCSTCKMNGNESSFHICRECTIEKHGFDIHTIIDEESPIHPDSFTNCSTCILKEHNTPGHTVIEYVPIRLDYQFKKNKRSVDIVRTRMTSKFADVRMLLTTMPELVKKKETEIEKIVDFMQRAKDRQNICYAILDVLRKGCGKMSEMSETKLKKLEKDNEEINAKFCFPEKIDLKAVLKIVEPEPEEIELPKTTNIFEDAKETLLEFYAEIIEKLDPTISVAIILGFTLVSIFWFKIFVF